MDVGAQHYKYSKKFECLDELAKIIKSFCSIDDSIVDIENLRILYQEKVSSILLDYYNNQIEDDRVKTKKIEERYQSVTISENIVNKMDIIYDKLSKIDITNSKKQDNGITDSLLDIYNRAGGNIEVKKSDTGMTPKQTIEYYKNEYSSTKIVSAIVTRNINLCSNCGKKMIVYPNLSELRCECCGNIMILQGIVFEDSQFYNQHVSGRAKKYSESLHCEKTLYCLLAREKNDIPAAIVAKLLEKMKAEFKANSAKSIKTLKCEKIGQWIKECKITKYNTHIPLLRKILTSEFGNTIIPPQLTAQEISVVLNEYNVFMEIFQELIKDPDVLRILGKVEIKNRSYYPYHLWKILEMKFTNDRRLNGLLECIHLPSAETLKRNDIIWKMMCKKRGCIDKYKPTDRSILSIL
jgi:hypothetical protein